MLDEAPTPFEFSLNSALSHSFFLMFKAGLVITSTPWTKADGRDIVGHPPPPPSSPPPSPFSTRFICLYERVFLHECVCMCIFVHLSESVCVKICI